MKLFSGKKRKRWQKIRERAEKINLFFRSKGIIYRYIYRHDSLIRDWEGFYDLILLFEKFQFKDFYNEIKDEINGYPIYYGPIRGDYKYLIMSYNLINNYDYNNYDDLLEPPKPTLYFRKNILSIFEEDLRQFRKQIK